MEMPALVSVFLTKPQPVGLPVLGNFLQQARIFLLDKNQKNEFHPYAQEVMTFVLVFIYCSTTLTIIYLQTISHLVLKVEGKSTPAKRGQHCPCWTEDPGRGQRNSLGVMTWLLLLRGDEISSGKATSKVMSESWETGFSTVRCLTRQPCGPGTGHAAEGC